MEALRQRYGAFRSLLEENREILEIITDLEEKRNGDYLFDMQYLRSNVRRLSEKVYSLIQNLNEISGEGYKNLYPVYSRIQQELQELLSRRKKIPPDSPVLPLEEITREKEDSVGGKMANLGELRNRVKVAVPEGFAISAQAYKDFIDAHGLQEAISERLARLNIDNLEDLILVSREIQQMILEKELPPALTEAIDREIQSLLVRQGQGLSLAVRSSALGEDSKISFAGQYGTVLNVPPDQVGRRYQEILASKFTPRAIFYFLGKGFREEDLAMGTGCIAMVRARVAGVLYTVDPLNPDRRRTGHPCPLGSGPGRGGRNGNAGCIPGFQERAFPGQRGHDCPQGKAAGLHPTGRSGGGLRALGRTGQPLLIGALDPGTGRDRQTDRGTL